MAPTIPGVLARIVDQKRAELDGRLPLRPRFEARAAGCAAARRSFQSALTARRPALIAEIKKASPSKGLLSSDFDPAAIARAYAGGGAAALSVLTDEAFFQGTLADLEAARGAVSIPVLRKDFTLDPFHVIEAAAHGADAILLIAAILRRDEMTRLRELAESYRMDALVEVHNAEELDSALDSGARILGVNNRNLHDFSVSLDTSLSLAARIPAGVVKVSESGIQSPGDVRTLLEAGFQAFLVGEHLMKSANPAATLRALAGA